jgi:GNAT superfamily N-acetyltransferase
MKVVALDENRFDEAVDALFDAFRDYPVMRYVVGRAEQDYDAKVRRLIAYFTDSRMARRWPVLGVIGGGELLAVANVNPPEAAEPPAELERHFERLSRSLGPAAMERFEAFASAEEPFVPEEPHYYLGMIGVRRAHQGSGLGRLLMDHVHRLSADHPRSTGVRLTTELRGNLRFYERLGYRVLGHARLEGLESWSMFRSDP